MIPAKRLETSQAYAGDGVIPAKMETSQAAGDGVIPAKRLETSQAYAGDGVIPAKRLETSQAYAGDGVIPAKRWRHLRHMQEMG